MNKKLEAYLQLARLSNLPTVWSNVLVGAALASTSESASIGVIMIAMLATSLFYVGGMAQNDLIDLAIDTQERPQRPLPSGDLTIKEARIFTLSTFALAFILIAVFTPQALYMAIALLVSICLYNFLHKKWSGSLLFMGLCRALVYCLAAAMVAQTFAKPLPYFATLLAVYIITLTLIAQKEAAGSLGYRKWLALGMVVIPLLAHYAVIHHFSPALVFTGILMPLWMLRSSWFIWSKPPKVVPAILGWLSGICLVDAYFLALLDRPMLSAIAVLCFIATVLGHKRILGT